MIAALRRQYNQQFSPEKYQAYLNDLNQFFPGHLEFRLAETPLFVPKAFTQKMLDTCDSIIDFILQPEFLPITEAAIPESLRVPREDSHPHILIFDFGVCQNAKGELEPQLVEMQGFPSIFAWHVLVPEMARRHFEWPENYSVYLNGYTKETYIDLLRQIIVGEEKPENVVLLELFPHKQKTRVDFYATEAMLGIKTVCLTEIILDGKELFYRNNGKKTPIRRIYNRLLFEELLQQPKEVQEKGKLFQQELNVTWVPHPNWFYRLSKYTLPFLKHPYVPETFFLDKMNPLPTDWENYVLKPLFSFAGQGVTIDVTQKHVDQITDPHNWILQRKVYYAPVLETPDDPAKAEIRLFYFWPPGSSRPIAASNLARLSKGKMIGVNFNKDKEWVGGSFCLFEQ